MSFKLPQTDQQGVIGIGDRSGSMVEPTGFTNFAKSGRSEANPSSDSIPSSSQARSTKAAEIPSNSHSCLPPRPILVPGFEWLEKPFREMLNVGLGHDRISYSNSVNPNHILTHMAIKSFEVTSLHLSPKLYR